MEKKAHCGKMWKMMGKEAYVREKVCSFQRKDKAKKFMQEAEKEKQEGIKGQWQLESPAR